MKIKLEEKSKQPLLEVCEKLLWMSQVRQRKSFFLLFNNVSIIHVSIHFSGKIFMGRKNIAKF